MAETDHLQYHYRRRKPEETLLYKSVAGHLETFLAERTEEGRPLAVQVVKELRGYLRCGILQYGFVRVLCPSCKYEHPVAYSCKGRGFCPSCCGARQAECEEHLLENILPWVPYRQYVVTLPIALRFWAARNPQLISKTHAIATKAVRAQIEARAKRCGIITDESPLTGTVTFVQRFGSALNLNLHYHILAPDGVFVPSVRDGGKPRFRDVPPPGDDDIGALVDTIAKKTIAHLRRINMLSDTPDDVPHPADVGMFDEHDAHLHAVRASVHGRIAFGERAGQKVRRVGSGFGYDEEIGLVVATKCASANGFTVHAASHTGAHQRQRLSDLVSYGARPPLATARLTESGDGDLHYLLKKAWSDGTQAIKLSGSELLEKLAALVPPARSHMVRYTGIFSGHSQWRTLIVLKPDIKKGFGPHGEERDRRLVKNHRRARLLARVFKLDIGKCPKCGTEMRIAGALHDPSEITRYLQHIGEDTEPPPIAPARIGKIFDFEDQEFADH